MSELENGSALEVYGERGEIREMRDRLLMLLPGIKECGPTGATALAQVATSMDLNPFLGEVWLIPQKKQGKVVGFSVMAGIKGIRRAARRQAKREGGYYTPPVFRLPTATETAGMEENPGDIIVACDIEIWTTVTVKIFQVRGVPVKVSGIGIYRAGEYTKMEPLQAARKRAEADALKQAFDLPFGSGDPVLQAPGDWSIVATDTPIEQLERPRESMALLYDEAAADRAFPDGEGEAAIETPGATTPEAQPTETFASEVTEEQFMAHVLQRIPYFQDIPHIARVMLELVLAYDPELEVREFLYSELETYASAEANRLAVAQSS